MKYVFFWFWIWGAPNSGSHEFDTEDACEKAKKKFYENVTTVVAKVAYCTPKK